MSKTEQIPAFSKLSHEYICPKLQWTMEELSTRGRGFIEF